MTSPEVSEDREAEVGDFHLIESLVEYVSIDDAEILKERLHANVADNPQVNLEILESAIAFGEAAHQGQERKWDDKPEGEKKEFYTHPLAATLAVNDFLGEETTTEALVITLLHDVIEDGKIDGRAITRDAIAEKFGEAIAFGVEALSDVRDSRQPGGSIERRKLKNPEYYEELKQANEERPELHLTTIKVVGDRATNLIEPFIRAEKPADTAPMVFVGADTPGKSKSLWESRTKKIALTNRHLAQIVTEPRVQAHLENVMHIAQLTMELDFTRQNWKQKFRAQRAAA